MSDDDVVERLRLAAKPEEWTSVWGLTVVRCSLMREAADEIERLRRKIDSQFKRIDYLIKWTPFE